MSSHSRYMVMDTETGELIEISDHIKKTEDGNKNRFQLSHIAKLTTYMRCADNALVDVLIFIMENKSTTNEVHLTQKMIIDGTGASGNTVNKVMTKLQSEKLLKKVRNGVYVFHPDIMVTGGNARWAAKDKWNKC